MGRSAIWNMNEIDREVLIKSAPRLNMASALNGSSYEKSGERKDDSAKNFNFRPVKNIHPFDLNGDYEIENASMSMHKGVVECVPWKDKSVISVAYRGTEVASRNMFTADTSYSGAKKYYNKLKEGNESAVYQLLSNKDADVIAIDGHSLGGFASGELLADLVEKASEKWKNDPQKLANFLKKIDYSSINTIGVSARAIEAFDKVSQAGGSVNCFYQPEDKVRKLPSLLGDIGETMKVVASGGAAAPSAEEYKNNTLFEIPDRFAKKLVMPNNIRGGLDAHLLTTSEPVIQEALSIYNTRKEIEANKITLSNVSDVAKKVHEKNRIASSQDGDLVNKNNHSMKG